MRLSAEIALAVFVVLFTACAASMLRDDELVGLVINTEQFSTRQGDVIVRVTVEWRDENGVLNHSVGIYAVPSADSIRFAHIGRTVCIRHTGPGRIALDRCRFH